MNEFIKWTRAGAGATLGVACMIGWILIFKKVATAAGIIPLPF